MTPNDQGFTFETWGLLIALATALGSLFILAIVKLGAVNRKLDKMDAILNLTVVATVRRTEKRVTSLGKRVHDQANFVQAHEAEIGLLMEQANIPRVARLKRNVQ